MTIRDQLAVLLDESVEHVVVGGQAGVLRQAIEFSHDLDVVVRASEENALRVVRAVRRITGVETDPATVLGRDFQQYVGPDGEEIDVHLGLIALPSFAEASANASTVDFLGVEVACLELAALYATKRTDRPKDAVHRQAIEARVRRMVAEGGWMLDEIAMAISLDADLLPRVPDAAGLARRTDQPLLQARMLAHDLPVAENPNLHAALRPVVALAPDLRRKLLGNPGRLAALLARLPLLLPVDGWHPRIGG